MKNNNISFRVFNEESVLIHWNDKINIKLIDSIISYKNLIEKDLKEIKEDIKRLEEKIDKLR